MNKFNQLEINKQHKIINGALKIFSQYGYHKASVSQIAQAADVSKSMIFYYFKTKLGLYSYLINFSFETIKNNYDDNPIKATDFFDFLIESAQTKMLGLKQFPYLMKFITHFYFETDKDVQELKREYLKKGEDLRTKMIGPELEYFKFKDTVDPNLLMKMLITWSEGYISKSEQELETLDVDQLSSYYDEMVEEFTKYLEMFRQNFYQEKYL